MCLFGTGAGMSPRWNFQSDSNSAVWRMDCTDIAKDITSIRRGFIAAGLFGYSKDPFEMDLSRIALTFTNSPGSAHLQVGSFTPCCSTMRSPKIPANFTWQRATCAHQQNENETIRH